MFCGATVASVISLPLLLLSMTCSMFACCFADLSAILAGDAICSSAGLDAMFSVLTVWLALPVLSLSSDDVAICFSSVLCCKQ